MTGNLLKAPGAQARDELTQALAAVRAVFPLKTAHRKELPFAVQALSHLLTAERGQSQGYWQKPAYLGAYLYYFLPWNLLRLAWLLPSIGLDLAPGSRVLDLGSGPLTLPLGLWLARPELRRTPLHFICADPAQRPMELGEKVLKELAGADNPWHMELTRAPLEVAMRKAGRVNLIMAGNVLNEIQARHETLEERLENIFYSMDRCLEPGGGIFILEPGTRLGGKLIAMIRRIALEEGYAVEAPCTHEAACPYAPPPEDGEAPARRGIQRQTSGWCHFSLPADGAPEELAALSRDAELEKERLSFACLLLRKSGGENRPRHREKATQGGIVTPVRVVSDPIRIPQADGTARYVCSAHGLGLLQRAGEYRSGMLVEALLADKAGRDAKSGAWLMAPAVREPAKQGVESAPAPRKETRGCWPKPAPDGSTKPKSNAAQNPGKTLGNKPAPARGKQKKSRNRSDSGLKGAKS